MKICTIEEITSLEQLDQLLAACKVSPVGGVTPGGGFYKLKCQKFRYPDGKIQYREYVDKRPATIVVPEDPDGKLIMVIQPAALVEEGSLIEFPAGYAEAGEDDITTGIRELLEETGLTTQISNITDLEYHYQDPGLIRQPVHAYLAEYCEQVQAPTLDSGEYIKLYKVSKSMFMRMLHAGYIKDDNTYIAAIQALFQLEYLKW